MTLIEIKRIYILDCIFKKYIKKVLLNNDSYVYLDLKDFYLFSEILNNSMLFSMNTLQDLTVIDNINSSTRFELYYNFFSYRYNYRLFVILNIFYNKIESIYGVSIPSIMFLFSSANWLEREVYDMFGLFFYGHEDLRRILTDYGFNGFPLRKDFPLSGYKEVRYDETLKLITSEEVKLSQEFRNFINI